MTEEATMPTELELAGRLAAALVLGGAIGLERELTGQVAGLRTHMSVALGAALFGIVSAYGWNEFAAVRAQTNVQIDVTRVASNIVTGVGFLGGGAILRDGSTVRGLTTAASLWVTAAVGLAVALGGYSLAAVTTIGLVFSLILLRGPRGWIRRRFTIAQESVAILLHSGADPTTVITALRALPDLNVRSISTRDAGDGVIVQADVEGPDLHSRLAELAELHEVAGVEVG
jgi:putative Mg2+ transporter-C (MgtC) family protein